MGFSFRSMFQPADQPGQNPGGGAPQGGPAAGPEASNANAFPMQNFPSNPVNGSSPFAAAGPLFKTVQGEAVQAAPISQSSPFAAQGMAAGHVPLTVGDVLPQLPPELVRLNSLPPEQPVAISVQVLDAALRSGQAALPIFEIYRVCPALFQSPVSPQDPRMVPLPASKLPRLIASTQGGASPAPAAASPFGTAAAPVQAPVPAAPHSPFSAAGNTQAGAGLTSLPPRRNGPPPPLADIPRPEAAPPSLSLPGNSNAQVFPASPFATVSPQAGPQSAPVPSPFSVKPPDSAPVQPVFTAPQGGLFAGASPVIPGTSPFAPAPAAAPVPAGGGIPSPFAAAASPQVPVSPAQPPAESPFSSLFRSKAMPTGQPAPDAPARQAPQSVFGPPPSAAGGPSIRLSLASLVKGYSTAELGFDPIMVPTWIMTSVPSSTVREWSQMATPLVELGALVDGITDVGFRNVLSQAKRDFQLRVPQDEVSGALSNAAATGSSTAAASAPASTGTATMRVGPAAQGEGFNQPPSETKAPAATPSFFSQEDPAAAPTVPLFGTPGRPPEAVTPGFAVPAPVSPPPPQESPVPFPAASASSPFAAASTAPSPAAFGAEPPAPAAFGAMPAPAPKADATFAPSAGFEPVAPLAEGFSSAQLLGTQGADVFGGVPPAPSIPVTNPFTGKAATAVVDVPEETEPAQPELVAAFASPEPENKPSAFSPVSLFGSSASASAETPFPAATVSAAAAAATPRSGGASGTSSLGIHSHNTPPDQILLRALLSTDDQLTPQKVVEMVCSLPGIAACVCLQGSRALSHVGAHKPQAREFQKQATDLAHHLRTLAPLIGIEGAETFTLTSGDRLMTFCFPEGAILGILHDAEPSLGLRDKITLIARELARMLA